MTEKAQRIELLEAQCKELKERENQLKMLNNSIMQALNEVSSETEKSARKMVGKEVESIQKKYESEIREIKLSYEGRIKFLETRVHLI